MAGSSDSFLRRATWRRFAPGVFLPVLILLVGFSLSGWAFLSLTQERMRNDEAHLDGLIHRIEADIVRRLTVYADAMSAGQAFLSSVPALTKDQWKAFATALDLPRRCPGIRGIGVVFQIPPGAREDFFSKVRADGWPNFSIKRFPDDVVTVERGPELPLYLFTYFEPEKLYGASVLGNDFAAEPQRRELMERARDTAVTALSNRLKLPTDNARRPAFALAAPVYRTGVPPASLSERRQEIYAWIFAPFVAADFLGAVMDSARETQEVDLDFYESGTITADNLLYGSGREKYERVSKLELAGQNFTLGWSRGPRFTASSGTATVLTSAASILVTVLLAAYVAGLISSRKRVADALVRQDAELKHQQFALDQHAIVAITDAAGTITYANDKFCAVSGYSREELLGKNHRIINSGIHPPEFFKNLYATITTGKVWRGEICNRNKSGGLNWMSATIVPFMGTSGRPEKYVAIRSDITALKLAKEQIRQSQARLASIFYALDEGVLLQGRDSRVLEFNESAEIILGVSRSQLEGKEPMPPWWAMVDEDGQSIPLDQRPTEVAVRTGESQRGVIVGLKKAEGFVTWISINSEPIRDDSGVVRAVVSSFIDITDRRRAENALRDAMQRLHLAVEAAEIGVWDWDIKTNRILWDERMFAIHGVRQSRDGYVDYATWASTVHPADLPEQENILQETVKSLGQSHREFRIRRRHDGSLRYIQTHELVLADDKGVALRVVGVNRDVTAAMLGEVALQESEARTRLFAEYAPVSVAMFDREMKYLVVSKQWLIDYKLTGQEVIGRSYYEVFPDTSQRWKEIHLRCLEGAVENTVSESVNQENGSARWHQCEVRPWQRAQGGIGGIVIFTLDITQRYQLEASLEKARDDALAASHLKSEFLAMMSHEIRTPMNGVIGMASLLLQTPLQSRQREMALTLAGSAEKLLVIINDILDFSKIEAGKMRIEPVAFNLRDAIEETAALMAGAAHRKNLHFMCDIEPALSTGVCGDSGRLQQILSNLLGNALKFTSKGEVTLSARAQQITDEEAAFRIEISDTGVGIPPAAKDRLFQPFVQADGSTTRRFGGTGLGLAICAQLVEIMGGRIGFDSVLGRGSTFWIELCLPRIALKTAEASEEIPTEARVLIVSEHELGRTVLLRQLEALSVSGAGVTGATAAVDLLVREATGFNPFSVVLLDLSRSPKDAFALAQTIRANPAIENLNLIVLSSPAEALDSAVISSLRIHTELSHPVSTEQLRNCLIRVYGRRTTPKLFSSMQTGSGPGLKLLLAEDNETNQLVAKLMLEQLGHSIQIAENGHAVLEWLSAEPFDAVLMDCQMPGMDGYEATRLIRAGRVPGLNREIPIIALTAYAMPADRARVIKAGMDDYVSKPLSKEALNAALSRCGLVDSPPEAERALPQPAQAPPSPRVFDNAQQIKLQAISTPDGSTVWVRALDALVKEMPGRLSALLDHAGRQDDAAVAALAHTIAGSAASIGGPALRSAGLALETSALAKDPAGISLHLVAVREAWNLLRPELLRTR